MYDTAVQLLIKKSQQWYCGKVGAISSVGRATSLHLEGHRFESCIAHLLTYASRNKAEVA